MKLELFPHHFEIGYDHGTTLANKMVLQMICVTFKPIMALLVLGFRAVSCPAIVIEETLISRGYSYIIMEP